MKFFTKIPIWFLVICPMLVSPYARAESEEVKGSDESLKKLNEYLENNAQSIAKVLYDNAVESTARLKEECSDKYNISLGNIFILEPMIFNKKSEHPIRGKWLHRYMLKRCGTKRTYNVSFAANNGNIPKYAYRLMGASIADPKLAKSALLSVAVQAGLKINKFCKAKDEFENSFMIFDSKLKQKKPDLNHWYEIWSIKACNHVATVNMEFKSDGKGGTYFTAS